MSIFYSHPISKGSTTPSRILNPQQLKIIATRLIHTLLIASMLTVHFSAATQVASAAAVEHLPISDLSNEENGGIFPINGNPIESAN